MEASRSKQQVVILDCCFSGAFGKGMAAKGEAVNLATQLGGRGRAVLTSSSATEYSFEQKEDSLSVYTHYVVEGLQTGIADQNGDGLISVDELHEFARAKVQEVAPAMQPRIYAAEEGYKIVVAQAPVSDPKLEYRKGVEKLVEQSQGKFSRTMVIDRPRAQTNMAKQRDSRQKWLIGGGSVIAIMILLSGLQLIWRTQFQSISPKPIESPISQITNTTKTNNKKAEEFFYKGEEKYDKQDYKGAIADYDQSIKLKPDYSIAYNNRGLARRDLGDNQGALADYDQAIKLKPDAKIYDNRGVLRSDLGDNQGALADFDQAIKLKPDFAVAYNDRGLTRRDLGDIKGAITDFDSAIQINKNWGHIGIWAAYYHRGNARRDLGDNEGAIADFDQTIKLRLDIPAAYNNRIIAAAYNNRANARLDLGNKEGAIADYQNAIELYPTDIPQRQRAINKLKKLQQ
jgi:tetratricopeptide (TPR) repeat protein